MVILKPDQIAYGPRTTRSKHISYVSDKNGTKTPKIMTWGFCALWN